MRCAGVPACGVRPAVIQRVLRAQGNADTTPVRPTKRQHTHTTVVDAELVDPSAKDKWGMNGIQRDNAKRYFYAHNAKIRIRARRILGDEKFSMYKGDKSRVFYAEPPCKITFKDTAPLAVNNDIRLILLGDLGLYKSLRNYPLAAFLDAAMPIMDRFYGKRHTRLRSFSSGAADLMPELTAIADALEAVRYKEDNQERPTTPEEEAAFLIATIVMDDHDGDDADADADAADDINNDGDAADDINDINDINDDDDAGDDGDGDGDDDEELGLDAMGY